MMSELNPAKNRKNSEQAFQKPMNLELIELNDKWPEAFLPSGEELAEYAQSWSSEITSCRGTQVDPRNFHT